MAFSSISTFNRLRHRTGNPTMLIVKPFDEWMPAEWEYSSRNDTFFNNEGEPVENLHEVWETEKIPVLEYFSEDVTQNLFEIGIVEGGNLSLITKEEYEISLRSAYRTVYRGEEHKVDNVQPRYDLCIITMSRVGSSLSENTI